MTAPWTSGSPTVTTPTLPQASISQMEWSFDGKRRRLFDAQDLYLLSKVFEVPIVYFFLPPPPCLGETVAHSGEPVSALLDAVFGTPSSLRAVDGRLVEIAHLARQAAASRRGHDPRHGLDHSGHGRGPVSVADCDARLEQIGALFQELVEHHRAHAGVSSS